MDNIEANYQSGPTPVEPARRLLPSWLVYSVFGIVLLLVLVLLLVPSPFTDYLYKFESSAIKWNLGWSPLIIAGLIIFSYLAFYLVRIFRITAVKPVQPKSVPLVERLIFGPLALWAMMYVCATITVRLFFRNAEDFSINAAAAAAAMLLTFPVAFFIHGLISFALAQSRKRYAIMFFVSVAVIAAMPLLLRITAPLADAAYNFQRSQDQAKTDQQLSQAHRMEDCANVGGDFGWVKCISTYMKSKKDYLECLKQAPSKKQPLDEQGVEYLCDREYESYVRRFTGHATEPGPDGVTYVAVPAEGTIAINDCTDFQRYRAWSSCVQYSLITEQDYLVCLQQSLGRTSQFGESGSTVCHSTYPKSFSNYSTCTSQVPADLKDACDPLILKNANFTTDISLCYELNTTASTKNEDSQAASCIRRIVGVNSPYGAQEYEKYLNNCGYVSEHQKVDFRDGNPCQQGYVDDYNALKNMQSIDQCLKVGHVIHFYGLCMKKTIHSSGDYQKCLNWAASDKYLHDELKRLCQQAWPSGSQ